MHTIKLLLTYYLNIYQYTSGKFIRLPNRIEKNRFGSENRIESKLFCPNWNALLLRWPRNAWKIWVGLGALAPSRVWGRSGPHQWIAHGPFPVFWVPLSLTSYLSPFSRYRHAKVSVDGTSPGGRYTPSRERPGPPDWQCYPCRPQSACQISSRSAQPLSHNARASETDGLAVSLHCVARPPKIRPPPSPPNFLCSRRRRRKKHLAKPN